MDARQLAKILIEIIIKYPKLSDSIVININLLFTFNDYLFLCYYLRIKIWFNTIFHFQTNKQHESQINTKEAYLRAYLDLEEND